MPSFSSSSVHAVLLLSLLFLCFVSNASASSDDDGTDGSEPVTVLLFMFIGLTVGALISQILSHTGEIIPYTVLVFLVGAIFALCKDVGPLGHSVETWEEINAEMMLFVFLPPLIFGEAMGLNWFHVKGGLSQAFVLAGPGVVVGAVVMGIFTKIVLPGWTWYLCMTFGSILSATDPVAVVALLKSANASPKLTIIIVGESLMNDGTAMVLFTLFFKLLKGSSFTAAEIIEFFLEAAFGSVLVGIVFGLVTVRWLRRANRPFSESDVLTQISVTICSAYLTFFTAQYMLEISGVLACCGAGLMLAWLAPPIILNHETLHNIWGMIEWAMNTLIFLLAGLIIGQKCLGTLRAVDYIICVVLYAFLILLRAAIIFLSYPLISRIGHRCTAQEAMFMAWAGLRGALGMALGLIVQSNGPGDMEQETSKLFFYIGGIATLTLLVNATTAKRVLIMLGLLGNDTHEKNLVISHMKKKIVKRMDGMIDKMAVEFNLRPDEVDDIRQSVSLYPDSVRESLVDSMHQRPSMQSLTVQGSLTAAHAAGGGAAAGGSRPSETVSGPVHNPVNGATQHTLHTVEEGENDDNRGSKDTTDSAYDDTHRSDRLLSSQLGPDAKSILGHGNNSVQLTSISSMDIENSHDGSGRGAAGGGDKMRQRKYPAPATTSVDNNDDDNDGIGKFLRNGQLSREFSARASFSQRIDSTNELSRALSIRSGRGLEVSELFLHAMRAIFMEIVRVRYWAQIEDGKIPRLSTTAQFLLYTIEVGLDRVKEVGRVPQDWLCLERELDMESPLVKVLHWLEDSIPSCSFAVGGGWLRHWATHNVAQIMAYREQRAVYMLTSFIDAHKSAQRKIHTFIAQDDDDDDDDGSDDEARTEVTQQTPEEARVVAESQFAVIQAEARLAAIGADTIQAIRSKQAARIVVSKEAEIVKKMLAEGLLTPAHAEEILETIGHDALRVEKERVKMYREQAKQKARERQLQKMEERTSLFSLNASLVRDSQQAVAASNAKTGGGVGTGASTTATATATTTTTTDKNLRSVF